MLRSTAKTTISGLIVLLPFPSSAKLLALIFLIFSILGNYTRILWLKSNTKNCIILLSTYVRPERLTRLKGLHVPDLIEEVVVDQVSHLHRSQPREVSRGRPYNVVVPEFDLLDGRMAHSTESPLT